MTRRLTAVAAACLLAAAGVLTPSAQAPRPIDAAPAGFDVVERSISDLQAALERKQVTSRQLVESYLARIEAYDQAGPRINAFITLNPRAIEEADALDRERAARGPRGPLHGIPLVVKDNFDTSDLPTTGASIALAIYQPARDAFQVARLRAAGAIVLGKTNLHELASGIVTVSSLGDQTRNPYDPTRNPGGSSGGTGAAIASNFAAAGLGTDTCGSIRIPASHNSLVGLRPTAGLSSRAGVIPLSHTQDVAGPLARSVNDVALLLDATVGVDPADGTTTAGRDRIPRSYVTGLATSSLKGARVGVLGAFFGDAPEDEEVAGIVRGAIDRMKANGAIVVDVTVPGLADLLRGTSVIDAEFKFDFADYLAAAANPPVRSLGEILERGLYHQALDASFRRRNAIAARDSEGYRASLAKREDARKAVLAAMDAGRVTVLVHPTIRRKPARTGESQGGSNCQLSPTTGLPALSVPAGFTADGLPVGIELVGRAFSEPDLLRLGSAFERTARVRRAPASTPPLPSRASRSENAPPRTPRQPGPPNARQPALHATFRQGTAGVLEFDVAVDRVDRQDVLLVAIHRAEAGQTGPAIGRLLRTGETSGRGEITLRDSEREDLSAGRLYVQLFTRQQPFGAARAPVVVK